MGLFGVFETSSQVYATEVAEMAFPMTFKQTPNSVTLLDSSGWERLIL